MAEAQVTIRFDRDAYREFKAECIRRDTGPTQVLRKLMMTQLEEWLHPLQAEERRLPYAYRGR